MPKPSLRRGSRVVLRAPTAADEPEFLACMRASRSSHRPWLYPPLTAEAFHAYLDRLDGERKYGFLACRRSDGAIVGWLNVSEIVRGALQSAFVGYGGVAHFAGQGYMTEALQRLLREAFVTLKLHRLEANIQPGNAASIALARRCGFQREGFSPRYLKVGGRWRDHERWAVRADEWRHPGRASSRPPGRPV
jgi:[ribosomal protein S5]-alanine N-acetyltransferase